MVLCAVKALKAAGLDPRTFVGFGGLDANWIHSHGVPTVTLGAGAHNPHSEDEFLQMDEFFKACDIAVKLATVP